MIYLFKEIQLMYPNFCKTSLILFTDNYIELEDKTNILFSSIMEETGGLGVDIIIDNGGKHSFIVALFL